MDHSEFRSLIPKLLKRTRTNGILPSPSGARKKPRLDAQQPEPSGARKKTRLNEQLKTAKYQGPYSHSYNRTNKRPLHTAVRPTTAEMKRTEVSLNTQQRIKEHPILRHDAQNRNVEVNQTPEQLNDCLLLRIPRERTVIKSPRKEASEHVIDALKETIGNLSREIAEKHRTNEYQRLVMKQQSEEIEKFKNQVATMKITQSKLQYTVMELRCEMAKLSRRGLE